MPFHKPKSQNNYFNVHCFYEKAGNQKTWCDIIFAPSRAALMNELKICLAHFKILLNFYE